LAVSWGQSLARKARGAAEMDTTTIGIAAGLICTAVYVSLHLYFKKTFDLPHTVLVFLAAFSMPGGVGLIMAGYYGSASNLPSSWREHVVVAGIVALGLAGQYVVSRLYGCVQSARKPATIDAKSDDGVS